jgi:hypothetical protein
MVLDRPVVPECQRVRAPGDARLEGDIALDVADEEFNQRVAFPARELGDMRYERRIDEQKPSVGRRMDGRDRMLAIGRRSDGN